VAGGLVAQTKIPTPMHIATKALCKLPLNLLVAGSSPRSGPENMSVLNKKVVALR